VDLAHAARFWPGVGGGSAIWRGSGGSSGGGPIVPGAVPARGSAVGGGLRWRSGRWLRTSSLPPPHHHTEVIRLPSSPLVALATPLRGLSATLRPPRLPIALVPFFVYCTTSSSVPISGVRSTRPPWAKTADPPSGHGSPLLPTAATPAVTAPDFLRLAGSTAGSPIFRPVVQPH
jgi:hypothetical protein